MELTIEISSNISLRAKSVTVWGSTLIGETYVGAMNEWFSDVLSKRCKLVRMPHNGTRHVNEKFDLGEDTVSFADGIRCC